MTTAVDLVPLASEVVVLTSEAFLMGHCLRARAPEQVLLWEREESVSGL